MSLIKSVRIRNFRSIIDETFDLDYYNCFVGVNDSGKSNVLKALNLFFNKETEFGMGLDFTNDYSQYAHVGAHQAKEITISLEINVPSTYKESGVKTWTKVWRAEGLHHDNIDKLFSGRNKATTFLSRIVYFYIPAVKSNEYFKYLLSMLYESMTRSADSKLREFNNEYSRQLQILTSELSDDIKGALGIDSAIQMPRDLRVLFRDLSFSTDDDFVSGVDLNHRGDGIKARHIPHILRYIQRNNEEYRLRNAIVNSYVWGYEEPENGIELLSSFDMANDLYNNGDNCQLLITTHSPAFYSIAGEEYTKCYYTYKTESGNSKYVEHNNGSEIDERIGLLPLVAPYILAEKVKLHNKQDELERTIEEMRAEIDALSGRIILLTEGKTDIKHIKTAIAQLSLEPSLVNRIVFYDFGEKDTLGDELSKLLEYMSHINNTSTIIGLFDRDKHVYDSEKLPFIRLGNGVYKASIPSLNNEERKPDDKICIEHYYTNSELTCDLGGKRIYLAQELNECGVSSDTKCFFDHFKENNSIKGYSIIDIGNKHVRNLSVDSCVASKNEFADYVMNHPDQFCFDKFRKIFELIQAISEDNKKN